MLISRSGRPKVRHCCFIVANSPHACSQLSRARPADSGIRHSHRTGDDLRLTIDSTGAGTAARRRHAATARAAAVSAVFRHDDRVRVRPRDQRAAALALAARTALHQRLSRRAGVHRRHRRSRRATVAARKTGKHLLVSFHGVPKALPARGRSLPLLLHDNRATGRRAAGTRPMPTGASAFNRRSGAKNGCARTPKTCCRDFAAGKHRHLTVVCPGFAADNLETLEEIQIRNRDLFLSQRRPIVRLHSRAEREPTVHVAICSRT